eukprot:s328_g10.t1
MPGHTWATEVDFTITAPFRQVSSFKLFGVDATRCMSPSRDIFSHGKCQLEKDAWRMQELNEFEVFTGLILLFLAISLAPDKMDESAYLHAGEML